MKDYLVRVLCICLIVALCIGVGDFSFTSFYSNITPIYSFYETTLSTVKGIIGLDVLNDPSNIQSDVSGKRLSLGSSGEVVKIEDYVTDKLLENNSILGLNVFPEVEWEILYISNYIYGVSIKNTYNSVSNNDKFDFACLRLTILYQGIQYDCLWVDFDNGVAGLRDTDEQFHPLTGIYTKTGFVQPYGDIRTSLFWFKSDSTIRPIVTFEPEWLKYPLSILNYANVNGEVFNFSIYKLPFDTLNRYPENGVYKTNILFTDIWNVWTGG